MSRTSNLSPVESMHFRCAIYRFWLFCKTYALPSLVDSQAEPDSIVARVNLLNSLSYDQLIEMLEVVSLLHALTKWLVHCH